MGGGGALLSPKVARYVTEIAAPLHLVEGTVKAYVSAVLDRLGVRNRVQAAIVAYEAGLVAA